MDPAAAHLSTSGQMDEFVQTLIIASEKAAEILRRIKQEDSLSDILVRGERFPKIPGICGKNNRFIQGSKDFVTLTKVLVQEVVRLEIGSKFPETESSIFGPESSTLINILGHKQTVNIRGTKEETTELLTTILSTEPEGILLTNIIRNDEHTVSRDQELDKLKNITLSLSNYGIWIDPIGGTPFYVNGNPELVNASSSTSQSLTCVTISLGVYDKETGLPIAGVINQPFHQLEARTQKWSGRCFWGVSYGDVKVLSTSMNVPRNPTKKYIANVPVAPQSRLLLGPWTSTSPGRESYDLLTVAMAENDACILANVHYWETCGPYALFRALGGTMLDYQSARSDRRNLDKFTVVYTAPKMLENGKMDMESCCHKGGIIASTSKSIIEELIINMRN